MDARTLIANVLDRELPPVAEETPLGNVTGWDSLKTVRLVIRLEELLERELSEGEIEALQTVGSVESLLRAN